MGLDQNNKKNINLTKISKKIIRSKLIKKVLRNKP
jgi:hypothetical protein